MNTKIHSTKKEAMREVPMREFYKNMKKFKNRSVIGQGVVVTSNKRAVFIVTPPPQQKLFSLSDFKDLQVKGLPRDLSQQIDTIVYGA